MPHAATRKAKANSFEPPPSLVDPTLDPDLSPEEQLAKQIEAMDIWQVIKNLPDNLADSLVYVYRTDPKIEARPNENLNIGKYPARMFDEATLLRDHGGGGYKLMIDAPKLSPWKITRHWTLPGTAKIPKRFIVTDTNGDPVADPNTPQPATKTDIVEAIKATTAAARAGTEGQAEALKASIGLVTEGAKVGMEMLASQIKGNGGGVDPQVAALQAEVAGLRAQIAVGNAKPASDSRLDKLLDAMIAQVVTKATEPPPKPPDPLDAIKTLTALGTALSGDGQGVLQGILGGGKAKEETVWEKGAAMLFEGVSVAIKENAPAVIDWLQRRSWYAYYTGIMDRQRTGAAVPPGAMPGTPPQQPAATIHPQNAALPRPPQPAAAPAAAPPMNVQPSQQEMEQGMADIRKQITEMIAEYWDNEFDGATAAFAVKTSFRFLVPMLKTEFKDLAQIIELAKLDPVLKTIATQDEFPQFAQEFLAELHKPDGTPMPGAA